MLITILTVIGVLIVLVLIHELGHFTAAKLMGIRVEEFGFGIPPRMWGKKFGETIYSINWLPVGGFVRLFGEDADNPEKIKKDRSRAFFAKSPLQRAIVLTAGVIMNFLLGWFLISYLFTMGLPVPKGHVEITEVQADSPAAEAQLMSNDQIIAIETPDDTRVDIQDQTTLIRTISEYADETVTLVVYRDPETLHVPIVPRSKPPEGQGSLGIVISDTDIQQYTTLADTLTHGFSYSIFIITSTFEVIGDSFSKLTQGNVSEIQVGGFVLVGQVVGEARKVGTESLLYVVAILSLNLAMINILPFPALDGGRLIFVVYEGIVGRKVNPRWEMYLHQIGMVLLLVLMLLITVNDILRIGR